MNRHKVHSETQTNKFTQDFEDPRSVKTHANATLLTSILNLSQVSRFFGQTVLQTKYLRRALYFLPDPTTSRSWTPTLGAQNLTGTYRAPSRSAPSLNPIIQTTFPSYNLRFSYLGSMPKHQAIMIVTRRDIPAKDMGGIKTFSNMLLTQPPCTAMEATIYEERDETKEYVARTTRLEDPRIEAETGITLGMVHQRVGEMFERHGDVVAIRLATV